MYNLTSNLKWIMVFFLILFFPYSLVSASTLSAEIYYRNGYDQIIPSAYRDVTVARFMGEKDKNEFDEMVSGIMTINCAGTGVGLDGEPEYLVEFASGRSLETTSSWMKRLQALETNMLAIEASMGFLESYIKWLRKNNRSRVVGVRKTDRQGIVVFSSIPKGDYVLCSHIETNLQKGIFLRYVRVNRERHRIFVDNENLFLISYRF